VGALGTVVEEIAIVAAGIQGPPHAPSLLGQPDIVICDNGSSWQWQLPPCHVDTQSGAVTSARAAAVSAAVSAKDEFKKMLYIFSPRDLVITVIITYIKRKGKCTSVIS